MRQARAIVAAAMLVGACGGGPKVRRAAETPAAVAEPGQADEQAGGAADDSAQAESSLRTTARNLFDDCAPDGTGCKQVAELCLDADLLDMGRLCRPALVRMCVADGDFCRSSLDFLADRIAVTEGEDAVRPRRYRQQLSVLHALVEGTLDESTCEADSSAWGFVDLACDARRTLCHEAAVWAARCAAGTIEASRLRDKALEVSSSECRFGDPYDCVSAGLQYVSGDGVAVDVELGAAFLQEACNAGEPWGCAALADHLRQNDDCLEDRSQALDLYRLACDQRYGAACWKLGRIYLKGDGVEQLPARADELFRRGCTLGYQAACAYVESAAK